MPTLAQLGVQSTLPDTCHELIPRSHWGVDSIRRGFHRGHSHRGVSPIVVVMDDDHGDMAMAPSQSGQSLLARNGLLFLHRICALCLSGCESHNYVPAALCLSMYGGVCEFVNKPPTLGRGGHMACRLSPPGASCGPPSDPNITTHGISILYP